MNERWLTIREAAARLGVGDRTIREHIRAGTLTYINVGRGKQRHSGGVLREVVTLTRLSRSRAHSRP